METSPSLVVPHEDKHNDRKQIPSHLNTALDTIQAITQSLELKK